MRPWRKSKNVATNETNEFNQSLPTDKGNSFTTREIITVKDQIIKSALNNTLSNVGSTISKALGIDTARNSYSFWYLLNFITDYFSNLVKFKFERSDVQKAVMIAIRIGIIYGRSMLWKVNDKIGAMYINDLETDILGYCTKADVSSGLNVLMTQETNENYKDNKTNIKLDINENTLLFLPFNHRVGGLVMWRPFLYTLEKLLKMIYTNSYQYLRTFTYNVKDTSAMTEELKMFTDINNPFLITVGDEDDSFSRNRFGSLELPNTGTGLELMAFIKEFQHIFYELIGRQQNVDKKNERNTDDEVQATQASFNVLQNELINNIHFLLEETKKAMNCNYELLDEVIEEKEVCEEDEGEDNDF